MAVQLGFVVGTLFIAVTNLADIFNTRFVFSISAFLSAIVNALFPLFSGNFIIVLFLRLLTGIFLAGVYPPGMKIMAGWFKTRRGLAIGALVGALTIGSALPHLVGSILQEQWKLTIFVSSVLSILAAFIVLVFVEDGPYNVQAQAFNFKYAFKILKNRPIRLAYLGYFGQRLAISFRCFRHWTHFRYFCDESII